MAAIATSVALHLFILYVPAASLLFGVSHLSWGQWKAVLLLSFPVILVDEAMKAASRGRKARGRSGDFSLSELTSLSGIEIGGNGGDSSKHH